MHTKFSVLLASLISILILIPVCAAQDDSDDFIRPNQSCTVFYAAHDDVVLGGNNEDWNNPLPQVWFVPATENEYGRIAFGFDNFFMQGGMNDQGLFFDGLALDTRSEIDTDLPLYPGSLEDYALATCATVDCVVDLYHQYSRYYLASAQLLFGDATGASIIVEPTELVPTADSFQVATNFLQSQSDPEKYTCSRYKTATTMLAEANTYSVELFRDILDATHAEGRNPTLYSNIYDLKNQIVYLYYYHDFETVVTFDLAQELAQGAHLYDLSTLFPQNEAAKKWSERTSNTFQRRLEKAGYDPDIDPATFAAYVGTYEAPPELGIATRYIYVVAYNKHLYVNTPGRLSRYLILYPRSATEFFHMLYDQDRPLDIRFVLDDKGDVVEAVMTVDNIAYTLPRVDDARVTEE
ncbi:MAG: hypothetical protein JXA10_13675 [Anaerolineae bacterium]|nr:hypothetical protein [Anaerolineae bacterium]